MSRGGRSLSVALALCLAAPSASAADARREARALLDALSAESDPARQPQALRWPVVLWYRDYNEVLVGSALGPDSFTSGQGVDVKNTTETSRCVGRIVSRVVPPAAAPPERCDGVGSDALLRCSDGRTIRLRIDREEHCRAGSASGRDHEGNVVRGLFGGSPERLEAVLGAVLQAGTGRESPPKPPSPTAPRPRGVQTGTGFFVGANGHVVTSYHVVAAATRVEVHLDDGDRIEAEVVARDPDNDLALLRVDAIREPLVVRSHNALRVGQEVATLGYPAMAGAGRERTATFGRVRAPAGARDTLAEVAVPVEPGNSGGPLLNRAGEVVGVVTSTSHPSGEATRGPSSYAIVSDRVYQMVERHLGDAWLRHKNDAVGADALAEIARAAQGSVVLVVVR